MGITPQGFLVVLSSPSGGGKTSICRCILQEHPEIARSISVTTRPARPKETNGKDYWFVTTENFEDKIDQGVFLEWAWVHNHYYGTLKEPIDRWLADGRVVLLDLDVQGASRVMEIHRDAVTIFILPPSLQRLEERLRKRGTNTEESIQQRLLEAPKEIAQATKFKYNLVNHEFEQIISDVNAILHAERLLAVRGAGRDVLEAIERGD